MGDPVEREQDRADPEPADGQRHQSRRPRLPKTSKQGDQGEREGDQLGPPQVALADRFDVGVERRTAGDQHLQVRAVVERGPELGHEPLRLLGRQVHPDQGVGGLPVARDQVRVLVGQHHVDDVGHGADVRQHRPRPDR